MENKIEIVGIIKSVDINLRYFVIRNEYINFSGISFWSQIKVSLYTEDNQKLFKALKVSKGCLVKVVGALKVNITKYNQLLPTIIPSEIKEIKDVVLKCDKKS